MLALVLLTWVWPHSAEAAVLIRDPGCYRVSGTILDAPKRERKLRINEGTRSQEDIRVRFAEPFSAKAGVAIQLDLRARKRGDARALVFEAVPDSVRVLPELPMDFSLNWKWLSGPGEGSCPR